MNYSKRLRHIIDTSNTTVEDIAYELGVHRSTVVKWLNSATPRVENRSKLERFIANKYSCVNASIKHLRMSLGSLHSKTISKNEGYVLLKVLREVELCIYQHMKGE